MLLAQPQLDAVVNQQVAAVEPRPAEPERRTQESKRKREDGEDGHPSRGKSFKLHSQPSTNLFSSDTNSKTQEGEMESASPSTPGSYLIVRPASVVVGLLSPFSFLGDLISRMPEQVQERKPKISASRKLMLKSLMVARAKEQLEQEVLVKEEEKQSYLAEKAPPLSTTSLSVAQLQDLCRELHSKIDVVDEERYDIEAKVMLNTREIKDLSIKVLDLRGKFKRPNLRRVRVSADAILRSLLGSKHKVSMDLRANLKSVKKDDTEKKRPVEDSDWRKNVEAMSGMEGRKKMFDAAKGSAQ
ncbi:unnamed protein product [Menidia menidia]|uniref:(Atlantic silverside) hypothetical protein n=1 Tax=Menidia menidia TaxID=238744 RepID=A0A8S4BZ09_9TELE|nr:unnamed protein product [Menidia menidia]